MTCFYGALSDQRAVVDDHDKGGVRMKFIVVIADAENEMSDGDYLAWHLRELADRIKGDQLSDQLLALENGNGITVGYAGLTEGLA